MSTLGDARVLMLGVGGLGNPLAQILVKAGVGHLTLVDDDRVSASNLHRQVLFDEADCGAFKTEVAARVLRQMATAAGHALAVTERRQRAAPETIAELLEGHDLVVDGSDNFATKFLSVDACRLASLPIVQAGVVRWGGWALATGDGPCLRCVFEDIPRGRPDTCADAGVVGPVVGVVAALQAGLALRLLHGDQSATAELWHYDGLRGSIRRLRVKRSPSCPLCAGTISELDGARYMPPGCAA